MCNLNGLHLQFLSTQGPEGAFVNDSWENEHPQWHMGISILIGHSTLPGSHAFSVGGAFLVIFVSFGKSHL